MARLPRLFVPGLPQLILQRGINGGAIFIEDADYQHYRDFLRDAAREHGVHLHAYVLMPDHVHLLLTPPSDSAASSTMQQLGRRYVRYFNDRHRRTGTLWEGRYRSTVLEPARFLLPCYRYLELNPLRAGLASEPANYLWSSCRHHLGLAQDPLIHDHALFWALGNTPFERQAHYREMLAEGSSSDELTQIRYAAHRGWMLGEVAPQAGTPAPNRRIGPLAKGRPRTSSAD